eukprot:Selendium_serpulae@DN1196_c0_g1_i2.p1
MVNDKRINDTHCRHLRKQQRQLFEFPNSIQTQLSPRSANRMTRETEKLKRSLSIHFNVLLNSARWAPYGSRLARLSPSRTDAQAGGATGCPFNPQMFATHCHPPMY